MLLTYAMSEDALIRLENLKNLKLSATELSDRVGGRYTYWNDLLAGNKSFGEKAARKIETALNLARGELDQSRQKSQPLALSTPNQAVAPVLYAQAATNNVASLDAVLSSLTAYLAQVDDDTRAAAAGLLSGLAKQPDNPNLRAALTALLTPSGFVEAQRKAA